MLETNETATRAETSASAARPLDLSILIVTWNSERWIERCLQSIPAACDGLAYEVVVYDNASDDATLARMNGNVRILRGPHNDGFAAGINRAFDASKGRYLFLLNPDSALEPGALAKLFAFLEAHPHVAAAAPLLVDEEGGGSQREFQLRRLPSAGTLIKEVLGIGKLFPKSSARYRYRDLDLAEPRRIEQPAAAAFLMRRDVYNAVGPLDEQFSPAWFEDVDYCRRLAQQKKEIYVVPGAIVRHFGGASLEHLSFARFTEVWYSNMWRYARKWMRAGEAEALRWAIIAGMVLRAIAALIGVRPHGIARGEAIAAYGNVLRKAWERWSPDSSPSSS